MVVVVLCIATALALVAALRRVPRRRDLVWLSAGLLGGRLGEAVLGAVVVYTKLNPYVVMTHFMVGIALLTDAFVLALRAGRPDGAGAALASVPVPQGGHQGRCPGAADQPGDAGPAGRGGGGRDRHHRSRSPRRGAGGQAPAHRPRGHGPDPLGHRDLPRRA